MNTADALADASLLWERAGSPAPAIAAADRAIAMYREIAVEPPLGWPSGSAAGREVASHDAGSDATTDAATRDDTVAASGG